MKSYKCICFLVAWMVSVTTLVCNATDNIPSEQLVPQKNLLIDPQQGVDALKNSSEVDPGNNPDEPPLEGAEEPTPVGEGAFLFLFFLVCYEGQKFYRLHKSLKSQ